MHMPVFISKYVRSIVFSDVYSKGSLDKLVLCSCIPKRRLHPVSEAMRKDAMKRQDDSLLHASAFAVACRWWRNNLDT